MSYMRESQLIIVGQRMRVDAVVKMLNDGQEQLMLGEVIKPGIRQGVEAPGGVRGLPRALYFMASNTSSKTRAAGARTSQLCVSVLRALSRTW